jgi:hypothetical protein
VHQRTGLRHRASDAVAAMRREGQSVRGDRGGGQVPAAGRARANWIVTQLARTRLSVTSIDEGYRLIWWT